MRALGSNTGGARQTGQSVSSERTRYKADLWEDGTWRAGDEGMLPSWGQGSGEGAKGRDVELGPSWAKAFGRRELDVRHQEEPHSPGQELAASRLPCSFCAGELRKNSQGGSSRGTVSTRDGF